MAASTAHRCILTLMLVVSLLGLQPYLAQSSDKERVRCTTAVDVAFLLDFSRNIGHRNSIKVRTFLNEAAVAFNVSRGGTRAAVLLYSNDGSTEIPFDYFSDARDFGAAVNLLPLRTGRNRITISYLKAHEDLFGLYGTARDYVPRIAIMLTDDVDRRSENYAALTEVALSIRNAGVHFLVIGIGDQINATQLLAVVEKRNDVILPRSFDELMNYLEVCVRSTCPLKDLPEVSASPRCTVPTDVAFLVDSSAGIGFANYEKLLMFIKKVILTFDFSFTGTRAAVVLYSNAASTRIWFDDFSDPEAFGKAVNKLPYESGSNMIDLALENAYSNLFGPDGDARSDVPRIAVVLTGGLQSLTQYSVTLDIASYPLKALGVRMVAVGIGVEVDESELQLMVDSKDDLLLVKSFDHLLDNVGVFTELLCTKVPTEVPITTTAPSTSYSRRNTSASTSSTTVSIVPSTDKKASLTDNPTKRSTENDKNQTSTIVFSAVHQSVSDGTRFTEAPTTTATTTTTTTTTTATSYALTTDSDVVFLLDASKDVTPDDYGKQKRFVHSLARTFGISANGPRASVLFYSANAYSLFTFIEYTDVSEFDKRLEAAPLLGQSRRIDRALHLTYQVFSQLGRPGPKVVILIVCSMQSVEPNVQLLSQAVRPLLAIGVKTYVIAACLVNGSRTGALDKLVARPDDLILVSLNEDPWLEVKTVAEHVQLTYEVLIYSEPLSTDTNILFIIDASGALSPNNYAKQKRFAKSLTQVFQAKKKGPIAKHPRAGVIIYGDTARVVLHPENYTLISDFNNKLDLAPRLGNRSCLINGLQLSTQLFSNLTSSGPRIAILLVSGGKGVVNGDISLDRTLYSLRRLGINIYVIAIGNILDQTSLGKLVARPSDLFTVATFEGLAGQLQVVARHVRSTYGMNYPLNQTTDIIFILDASSSVTTTNFTKQKKFIKSMVKVFRISSAGPRVSVIVYSSDSYWIFSFNEFSSREDFNRRVDAVSLLGHSRRIDRALQFSFQMFSNTGRPGPKVVILFAFGRESVEPGSKPLEQAIKPLRELGVRTYVIVVGSTAGHDDFKPLVERVEDLFVMKTDTHLQNSTGIFASYLYSTYVSTDTNEAPSVFTLEPLPIAGTAKVPTQHIESFNPTSYEIAPLESTTAATSALKPDTDVIFMLDASKNVSPEDYVRQKEFVKSMVRVLHIRAVEPFIRGPRACVIIYSSNAYLIFDFTEYATIEDFETKLDSAVLLRESWKVAKALHLSFKMFSMASTSRKMVAVLVTAGHYDEESYVDEESLDASTQGLRDLRARTYIIAIGDVSKSRKLEPLVASPEDIFVVSSTDELNSVVSPLVEHIRETYDVAVQHTIPMDIIFLADASSEVSPEEFQLQLKLIKLLVEKIIAAHKEIRISVISYGADAKVSVTLDQSGTLKEFIRSTENSQFVGGDRRIDIALHTAQQEFQSVEKSSPKKAIVVLTSGKQVAGALPLSQAVESLRYLGVKLYAVVIGMARDYDELSMVVAKGNIYRVPSFPALSTISEQLETGITSEVAKTKPRLRTTTTPVVQVKQTRVTSGNPPTESSPSLVTQDIYSKPDMATQFTSATSRTTTTVLDKTVTKADKGATFMKTTQLLPIGEPFSERFATISASSTKRHVTDAATRASVNPIFIKITTKSSRKPSEKKKTFQMFQVAHSPASTRPQTKRPYSTKATFSGTVKPSTHTASRGAADGSTTRGLTYGSTTHVTTAHGPTAHGTTAHGPTAHGPTAHGTTAHGPTAHGPTAHGPTAHGTTAHGPTAHGPTAHGTTAHGTTAHGPTAHGPTAHGTTAHGPTAHGPTAHGPTAHGPTAHGPTAHGTTAHGPTAHGPTAHGTTAHGTTESGPTNGATHSATERVIRTQSVLHSVPSYTELNTPQKNPFYPSKTAFMQTKSDTKLPDSTPLTTKPTTSQNVMVYSITKTFLTLHRRSTRSLEENKTPIPTTTVVPTSLSHQKESTKIYQTFPIVQEHISTSLVNTKRTTVKSTATTTTVSSPMVSVLPTGIKPTATPAGVPACSANMDIAFLIDASGSVGDANFNKEKQFVEIILRKLNMKPPWARAAVIVYSDLANVAMKFGQCLTSKDFNEVLDRIHYAGRTTRIDKALCVANTELFSRKGGMRPHVAKAIVLVTDGRQSPVPGALPLDEAAMPLRRKDVNLLAVGVGGGISASQLENIISRGSDLITVDDFDELLTATNKVTEDICKVAEFRRCTKKLDIAILVDSSGSIGKENYGKQKEFVKAVTRTFRLSRKRARVGVIVYSDQAVVAKRFNKYFSQESLSRIIDTLPYRKGTGRIDRALKLASEDLLSTSGGARRGAHKVVVVITDGHQTNSHDAVLLKEAADQLLSTGARIYVVGVGIGDEVKENELQNIVERKRDILITKSFDDLPMQVLKLARLSCHVEDIEPCDNVLDIGVVVASSVSTSPPHFKGVKSFVKAVAETFQFGSASSRLALMLYGAVPHLVIHLTSVLNTKRLGNILLNLPNIEGTASLEEALQVSIKQVFSREADSRRGVPKVLVVICDQRQKRRLSLRERNKAVSLLNLIGVRLLIISIGPLTKNDNLRYLTQKDQDVFTTPTYADLKLQARRVSRRICEITTAPKCTRMLDICFIVDSSGMIGLLNYEKLKAFLKALTYAFDISSEGTHIGVVLYSDIAKVEIKLNDYDEDVALRTAIGDSPYLGKITRIDRALRTASERIFIPQNGLRPGAKKVVVLFSDGHQTRTFDSVPLRYAVGPLNEKGVQVLVVATSKFAHFERLRSMTRSYNDVLEAKSFDLLSGTSKRLVEKICGDDITSL